MKQRLSPSDPIRRAIVRRNRALCQPYTRENKIVGGKEKATWSLGSKRAVHRDYIRHHVRLATTPRVNKVDREDIQLVDQDPVGDPVGAFVNHGRWMARCPECAGCEVVEPTDPVFMCLGCYNFANEGRLRPVVWTKDKDTIEEILVERPLLENRNWRIVESVQLIAEENLKHGLPIPTGIEVSHGLE